MNFFTSSLWSRLRPSRRATLVGLSVLGGLLILAGAGAAYATYDYSERYEGRILPGSSIAGVNVGGLEYEDAVNVVKGAIGPQLNREIRITTEGRSWTITPKELGARSDAEDVVQAALQASREASFLTKMHMRLFDSDLDFTEDVAIRYPRQRALGFVEGIAKSYNREPVDAQIDYSTGWVEVVDAKEGREVNVRRSHRSLMHALRSGTENAELRVKTIRPKEQGEEFDQILLVRIGENKLYLYEDGQITHTWTVATGQPEYMTPTGLWEVTELRYMPTWVNPAPDTWGANMPDSIPPGPSNPLGLRAINWSAPAIRFHGTSATYSLGYNASHGCVRMANEDVIQLYDMIEVGTPIVSVVAGELKPMYSSSSVDPVPVAENEESATEEADAAESDDTRKKGNKQG